MHLRIVQTCVNRMRLRSKIENFLILHALKTTQADAFYAVRLKSLYAHEINSNWVLFTKGLTSAEKEKLFC